MHMMWIEFLCCPRCQGNLSLRAKQVVNDDTVLTGELTCISCGTQMAIEAGIADLLLNPPESVQNEIRGQIAQRTGQLPDHIARRRDEKYRALDFEEFRWANIESALAHIPLRPGMTVLDQGAGDGWLAPVLTDHGLHYLGVDVIYFENMRRSSGSFIIADLNQPPLKDNHFDLIITSASLHHAYRLTSAMDHIARLLRPGGFFLAVSEPTKGLLRNNNRYNCDAHPDINEHTYWIWEYLQQARRVGLQPRTYLPGYVCRRLESGATSGLRFGRLGKVVSYLWQITWLRNFLEKYGYLPASLLFGMPLVMAAQKR